MASSFTCDGCGCNLVKPVVVGYIIKRDYCEDCAGIAAAFLEADEVERLAAQSAFQGKREKLINEYAKDNFKLPDVP